MRKTLFLFCFAWLSLTLSAQTKSAHITFKGVPIDGTLQEYVQEMENVGFTSKSNGDIIQKLIQQFVSEKQSFWERNNGIAILYGEFAGYKNCQLLVSTLEKKDLVNKITVRFPACKTWEQLSDNYFSLKKRLSEKYGRPSSCIEEFHTYTGTEPDDYNKIYFIHRCKYVTTFTGIWRDCISYFTSRCPRPCNTHLPRQNQ